MKQVVLTGIKPTGTPHIGNYFGAIKQAIELSDNLENDNFIVNIKTTNIDTDKLKYWPYYSKITKRIDEFADKINKKSKIKITF